MARRYHEIKGPAEYTAKTIVSESELRTWKRIKGEPESLLEDEDTRENS